MPERGVFAKTSVEKGATAKKELRKSAAARSDEDDFGE